MRRELVATIGDEQRTLILESRGESGGDDSTGNTGSAPATIPGSDAQPQVTGGEQWRVWIDGAEHLVDAVEVRPGSWSLIVDGCSYLVDFLANTAKPGGAVRVAAAEVALSVQDARRARLGAAVAASGGAVATGEVVRAPIAGKIVKFLVAVGDDVAVGQSVALLEAMKMENELEATRGGVVQTIHSEAGKSVDTGDTLVTLV